MFRLPVPFQQNWAGNVAPAGRAANFGNLGDTSVQLRYRLLDGSPTATTVTGYVSVLFPTGHASPLEPKFLSIDQTGLGAFSFTWGLDIFKYLPGVPVLFYANIWYTNFADGWVNRARVNYPDQVVFNLAMEIPLQKSPDNRWALLLEVLSNWDAGRMFGPPGQPGAPGHGKRLAGRGVPALQDGSPWPPVSRCPLPGKTPPSIMPPLWPCLLIFRGARPEKNRDKAAERFEMQGKPVLI